jgi:hypothetical protein
VSGPRDPAVTAAADQAQAQAADILRRVGAGYRFAAALEHLTTGEQLRPPGRGRGARGPRRRVLERVEGLLERGELAACPHVAAEMAPGLMPRGGEQLEAMLWLSWHPRAISCGRCAAELPRPGTAEDYTCDGCGHVGEAGDHLESVTYVVPASAEAAARTGRVGPPLLVVFGLCPRCAAASR